VQTNFEGSELGFNSLLESRELLLHVNLNLRNLNFNFALNSTDLQARKKSTYSVLNDGTITARPCDSL
jgi:hypothetical protein